MTDPQPPTAEIVKERLRTELHWCQRPDVQKTDVMVAVADLAVLLAALDAAEQAAERLTREYHALLNEPMYAGTRDDWRARAEQAEAECAALLAIAPAPPTQE